MVGRDVEAFGDYTFEPRRERRPGVIIAYTRAGGVLAHTGWRRRRGSDATNRRLGESVCPWMRRRQRVGAVTSRCRSAGLSARASAP
jgi:hypothetical protein